MLGCSGLNWLCEVDQYCDVESEQPVMVFGVGSTYFASMVPMF